MGINIRNTKHGVGGRGGGEGEAKVPYRHFVVAVATWGSYKAPTMSTLRHHSLNRDITGSAKYPPEKQTWTLEALCMDRS